jgi:Na+-driven multidrug efflux pump
MGPTTTYMDTVLYLTYFLAICTTNQIAELLASKRYRDLQLCTSRLLGVAAACGTAVTIVTWAIGSRILSLFVGSGGGAARALAAESRVLIELASTYSCLRAAAAPLSVLGMVAQAFCLVTGHTRTVAQSVLVASIVNAVGDIVLTPRFGMQGAAVATAVASSTSALWLLRRVFAQMLEWRELEQNQNRPRRQRVDSSQNKQVKLIAPTASHEDEGAVPLVSLPDRGALGELLAMSAPLCFRMWAIMASHALLTVRAAHFGAATMAAQNVLVRIFYFLSAVGDGIGSATQTFVPATLYPRFDAPAFRRVVARLARLASVAAGITALVGLGVLADPSVTSWLVRDGRIVAQLRTAAPHVAASLLLHPLIALTEGLVITRRDFGNVFKTYAVTVAVFVVLLRSTVSSLAGVWRTLLCWQGLRLLNYWLWRKDHSSKVPIMNASTSDDATALY